MIEELSVRRMVVLCISKPVSACYRRKIQRIRRRNNLSRQYSTLNRKAVQPREGVCSQRLRCWLLGPARQLYAPHLVGYSTHVYTSRAFVRIFYSSSRLDEDNAEKYRRCASRSKIARVYTPVTVHRTFFPAAGPGLFALPDCLLAFFVIF